MLYLKYIKVYQWQDWITYMAQGQRAWKKGQGKV